MTIRAGSHFFPGELDDLMDAAMDGGSVKERDGRVVALERELAIEGAVDHIACLGTFVGLENRQAWFTAPEHFHLEEDHEKYVRALRYLELLGLVERHPQHPDWVLIKQEDAV